MDNQTGLAFLNAALGSMSIPSQIFRLGMGGGINVDMLHKMTLVGSSNMKQAQSSTVPFILSGRVLLDEQYHYDFTNITDYGVKFYRGGKEYKRPCGWRRYAFKVDSDYSDDIWLNGKNPRPDKYSSAKDEWPVSYHGTTLNNGLDIAKEGFKLSKGERFKHGHGIYSTPDIEVAFLYATSGTLEGKTYKFVMQNRVNPKNVKTISQAETGVGEYWISPSDEDIRPYGFCVKKIP